MSNLRVIGDCHGCITSCLSPKHRTCYADIIEDCDYSVQIGDFGFIYKFLNELYYKNHVVVLGNHENYDIVDNYENLLTTYGNVTVGSHEFYYARGGFSIDKVGRVERERTTGIKSWWHNEQLNIEQREDCLKEYIKTKPRVVITHSCPAKISKLIGSPGILQAFGWPADMVSVTQQLLQDMWGAWEPELWIFGHYHRNWQRQLGKTNFMCIDELNHVDFDEDWNIL